MCVRCLGHRPRNDLEARPSPRLEIKANTWAGPLQGDFALGCFRSKVSTCLLVTDPRSQHAVRLPHKLPGMHYSASEQCQILFGTNATFCRNMEVSGPGRAGSRRSTWLQREGEGIPTPHTCARTHTHMHRHTYNTRSWAFVQVSPKGVTHTYAHTCTRTHRHVDNVAGDASELLLTPTA